jgi:hypothetical protein
MQHGPAASSGSNPKAPGSAGGYLLRFRHFCSGSLALASLNLACRNPVPTFPQGAPPSLLTTAACGGDQDLIADLEGRPFISRTVAQRRLPGDTRDTRPNRTSGAYAAGPSLP